MGHFSYTCRLSGLPITGGDKAVLIPLISSGPYYDNSEESIRKFGKTCYVSNNGPDVFFKPLMFPIFGEYNEYGNLENIIKDDNTEALEEYFALSIEQIVGVITSGRKDDGFDDNLKCIKKKKPFPKGYIKGESHFDQYQRITGDKAPFGGRNPDCPGKTFRVFKDGKMTVVDKPEYDAAFKLVHEHYARYQEWTKVNPDQLDDYGKPEYEDRYRILIQASGTWMRGELYETLAGMKSGFYKENLDLGIPAILNALGFKETGKSTDERYNRVFTNGLVSVNSDGNWIHQSTNGDGIYNPGDLKRYCKKKGLDLDISEMSGKGYYEQVYDYILPVVNKIGYQGRWEGDRVRSLFLCGDSYSSCSEISTEYFNQVKKKGKEFLKRNVIDWHNVSPYYYTMGHYFSPVGTGPQDGDPEGVLKVISVAKKILLDDIKKRSE